MEPIDSPQSPPELPADVARILLDVFGFSSLRPGQAEVLADVVAGRHAVAVMPTGAGKSVCYQLPAVLFGETGGVTIVVSPLIALMKDQVDTLHGLGVAAEALTSAVSAAERSAIIDRMRRGELSIVYVAPERFRSPRFLSALSELGSRLQLFAVDEAHCISEWGHEFRPDYRRLGDVVRRLDPARILALTATATPEVRRDIARQLGLESPGLHVFGFDRPNLRYEVERAGGIADKCTRLVERVSQASGPALVYAVTRKNTERYAAALAEAGVRVETYHAGLGDTARARAQDAFMTGAVDAVVATNAFGMGVDKANIRLVVHADLARSPEAYYQESGRGGRDGEPTDCVLLFNHSDARLQEFMIEVSHPPLELLRAVWSALRREPELGLNTDRLAGASLPGEPHVRTVETALRVLERHGYLQVGADGVIVAVRPDESAGLPPLSAESLQRREQVERDKLAKMIEYAYNIRCRRQFMLDYFGDEDWQAPMSRCEHCDNCTAGDRDLSLDDDQRREVMELTSLVARLSGRFGRKRVAQLANGADDDERWLELPEHGTLPGRSAAYLMDVLRSLEAAGLVQIARGEYPTLEITRLGTGVCDGSRAIDSIDIVLPERRSGKRRRPGRGTAAAEASAHAEPVDPQMAEHLREWRAERAAEAEVPAYRIFSNRTLEALARVKPTTLDGLGAVHGIGPSRLEGFGRELVAAISQWRGA